MEWKNFDTNQCKVWYTIKPFVGNQYQSNCTLQNFKDETQQLTNLCEWKLGLSSLCFINCEAMV